MNTKLTTWDPKKRKVVLCGELRNNILFRKVKPEHFMQICQGWGIQEIAFNKIVEMKVKKIILSTGIKDWEAPIKNWIEHGSVADYGNGKQRFLSTKYMTSKKVAYTEEEKLKQACQDAML